MSETSRKLAAYEEHPRTPEYAELRFGCLEPHLSEAPDDGTYYLNMGPHHPSTHGVLRLVLRLDGEKVVDCEPVIGYSHRAHEKMAERGLYSQFLPNPSRMDYLGGMIYNAATARRLSERSTSTSQSGPSGFGPWSVSSTESPVICCGSAPS